MYTLPAWLQYIICKVEAMKTDEKRLRRLKETKKTGKREIWKFFYVNQNCCFNLFSIIFQVSSESLLR